MLKRRVLAYNIKNLTDARYFAAWYIDYIHFDLSQINLSKILEILEWVEGVDVLLDISQDQWIIEHDMIIEQIAAERVHLPAKIMDHRYKTFAHHAKANADVYILDALPEMSSPVPDQTYLRQDWISQMDQLDGLDQSMGIAVTGGEEEDVGLKAFDELDNLFDYLDEE